MVGLSKGQASRWLFGYSYPYRESLRRRDPLVRQQLGTREARRALFLDLIELRAAKLFLDHGISPQKVRRAFKEAQEVCDQPFPFASRRIYTSGPRIFLKLDVQQGHPGLLELLTGGQWVIRDVMKGHLEQLDFDEDSDLVDAWWPLGRQVPVLITPKRAFGSPTVKTPTSRRPPSSISTSPKVSTLNRCRVGLGLTPKRPRPPSDTRKGCSSKRLGRREPRAAPRQLSIRRESLAAAGGGAAAP